MAEYVVEMKTDLYKYGTLQGHNDTIAALVVIDELRICSCSCDTTIKVWSTITGACEKTLEGHTKYVTSLVLLLNGRVCTLSYDGTAKIWNVETGICELDINMHNSNLCKVIQLHDGRLVVSVDGYDKVFLLRR
jgi:WD40 repeat protein